MASWINHRFQIGKEFPFDAVADPSNSTLSIDPSSFALALIGTESIVLELDAVSGSE
ncbi:MAG: hypothetical protein AB8B94_06650 [Hyphomicrobiales bacterium]